MVLSAEHLWEIWTDVYALCTHAQQPWVFVDIIRQMPESTNVVKQAESCAKLLIGSYARIEQLIVQWSHMSGSHFLHKPNISISGNPAKVDCLLLCDACEKWQLWLASQPDFLLLVTSCGRLCPLHHHLLPLFRLIIILDLLPCFSPHSSLSSPFFILFFFLLTFPLMSLFTLFFYTFFFTLFLFFLTIIQTPNSKICFRRTKFIPAIYRVSLLKADDGFSFNIITFVSVFLRSL